MKVAPAQRLYQMVGNSSPAIWPKLPRMATQPGWCIGFSRKLQEPRIRFASSVLEVDAGVVLVQAVGHRGADQHVVELLLADAPVAVDVHLPQRPLCLRHGSVIAGCLWNSKY